MLSSLDLKAHSTMCNVTSNELNLDDIAVHSNGMTKLTVYGRKYVDCVEFLAFGLGETAAQYQFSKQIHYDRLSK